MKSTFILPTEYAPIAVIDLVHNKRQFWLVNGISLALLVVALLPAALFVPLSHLFEGVREGALLPFAWRMLALGAGAFVYILLHELVHGIIIRIVSGKWGYFGFKSIYAYAGSHAYFAKAPYLIIALAPVVLWGILLGISAAFVPRTWFWVVYIIELINVSGAAGDLYVTARMVKLPRDIFVKDDGTAMTVYARKN